MSIVARCSCGKAFQARIELAGKSVRCPACGGVLVVPPVTASLAGDDPLGIGDFGGGAPAGTMRPNAQGGFPPQQSFPAAAPRPQTLAGARRPAAKPAKRSNAVVWIAGAAGGGVLLLVAVAVILFVVFGSSSDDTTQVATTGSNAPSTNSASTANFMETTAPNVVTSPASPAPTTPAPSTIPGLNFSPSSTDTNDVAPAASATSTSNSATSASSVPVAANVAPAESWQVQPDPPKSPVSWPDRVAIDAPVPQWSNRVLYSATPSRFAVLGLNVVSKPEVELWDVLNARKVAELKSPIQSANEYALSPDGRLLAAKSSGSANKGKLEIWSFETGQPVGMLEYGPESAGLAYFEFTAPDQLVTHYYASGSKGYDYRIVTYAVPSGTRIREIELAASHQRTKMALSPGGRYLAINHTTNKLSLYDLVAGKLAAELELAKLVPDLPSVFYGMSFSPDGKQLGIVFSATNSHLFFLDLATGRVADSIPLAGKPPTASAYAGAAVEWIGDQGWCLFGGTIVDRQLRRAVWNLELGIINRLTARRTLQSGWIAEVGSGAARRLKFLPFPSTEIQQSVAAMNSGADAYLRPEMAVSLNIKVGKLRHGTPADTEQRLADIFSQRFEADGILVAEDQPVVLNVTYDEAEGPTLTERAGFGGQSTGRTVQSTKVDMKMELALRGGSRKFWSDTLDYDPYGVTLIGKEPTEANVRDAIFRQVLYSLTASPIPFFVPKESGLSPLPGSTEAK